MLCVECSLRVPRAPDAFEAVFCVLQVDGYAFSLISACTVGNCVCQNFACFQTSFEMLCMGTNVFQGFNNVWGAGLSGLAWF